MSTVTARLPQRRAASRRSGMRWFISDVAVLAGRSLARIAREPEP